MYVWIETKVIENRSNFIFRLLNSYLGLKCFVLKILPEAYFCSHFLLLSLVANAAVTYVHTDHLGSVVAEFNSAGQITKRFHYKPFGESIEAQQDDIGCTGHKYDTDLGLTYMQARLNSESGRNDDALSRTFIHESFHANHTDSAMQGLWDSLGAEKFNPLHRSGYNSAASELFKK